MLGELLVDLLHVVDETLLLRLKFADGLGALDVDVEREVGSQQGVDSARTCEEGDQTARADDNVLLHDVPEAHRRSVLTERCARALETSPVKTPMRRKKNMRGSRRSQGRKRARGESNK